MSKGFGECNKKISTLAKVCYRAISFDDITTVKGAQVKNFEKASEFNKVDYEAMSFSNIIRARRAEEKNFWKDLPQEDTQFPNDIKENLRGHINQTAQLYEAQFDKNHHYYIFLQPLLNEVSNNASWVKGFTGSNIDFFESDYVQSFNEL